MDKEKFKRDLRQIVDANPQEIKFKIKYCDNRDWETFTSKKEFGLRILEIFEEEGFANIDLSMCKEKGYIGNLVSMKTLIKQLDLVHNIEQLDFLVETEEDIKKRQDIVVNMPLEEFFENKTKY